MTLSCWKQRAFLFLLFSITGLAAYHFGSLAGTAMRQQDSRTPIPTVNGLFIDPQTLDQGEVWERPTYTFPIRIHNRGSAAQTIERFQTTCGCLRLDPLGKTIPPGEHADFVGTLDLTPRHPSQTGVARWQ